MLTGPYKFILLVSLLFALFIQGKSSFMHRVSKGNFSKELSCHFEKSLNHDLHYLHTALIVGPCTKAPKETSKVLRDFGLIHLITPSGLHIAGITMLLNRLPVSALKKSIFWLLTWPIMIFLNYLAIARICLYHFWNHILKKFSISISHFSKLNLTFIVDFFIGSYHFSPQSFHFSYHFLGTILSADGKKRMFFYLLLSQAMMAIIYQYDFKLLQSACGILISAIFSIFYLLLLVATPFKIFHPGIAYCLNIFMELLHLLNNILPNISLSLDLITFVAIILLRSRKFLILFFIFHTTDIGFNGTTKFLERSSFYRFDNKPNETFFIKETMIEIYSTGHCRINLHDYFWDKECYKKKFKKL